jgi:hypothetical protein
LIIKEATRCATKELNISLMTLPRKSGTTVSELLVTTKDLDIFNLKVGFVTDGPSKFREVGQQQHDNAARAHLTEIIKALAQNKTIKNLSVSLPVFNDNDEDANLLESHICNNSNLIDVGALRCSGLTSKKKKKFKAICANNELFLEVIGMVPTWYSPPEVWPNLMERSLKTRAGHDAVFQYLRMRFLNDFKDD